MDKLTPYREIAGRIWCDPRIENYEMDSELAEVIAETLQAERDRYEAAVREVLVKATDNNNYVIISPHIDEIMADIKAQLEKDGD